MLPAVPPNDTLTARWHRSISEIPIALAGVVGDNAIPFYRWSWLEALERSGSIIPDQGWQPLHLGIWRDDTHRRGPFT